MVTIFPKRPESITSRKIDTYSKNDDDARLEGSHRLFAHLDYVLSLFNSIGNRLSSRIFLIPASIAFSTASTEAYWEELYTLHRANLFEQQRCNH